MAGSPDTQWPELDPLDPRLNVIDDDVAEARLRGRISDRRFLVPDRIRVIESVAGIRSAPHGGAGINTQALFGETLLGFEQRDGWTRVRAERDSYAGWVESAALGPVTGPAPGPESGRSGNGYASHLVCVPRSFLYPVADMKVPPVMALSIGSAIEVTGEAETRGTRFLLTADGGAVIASHLRRVGEAARDWVGVAEMLERTPYLWGGASAFGIDCSGLVQLSMHMAGREVLRDSDMQAATMGSPVDPGPDWSGLERGDLIFWRGHVAICTGANGPQGPMIIHANGHTMDVSIEPVRQAVERITWLYERPIGVRRP